MVFNEIKHRDDLHSIEKQNITLDNLRCLEQYVLLTASYIRHNAVMAVLQSLNASSTF